MLTRKQRAAKAAHAAPPIEEETSFSTGVTAGWMARPAAETVHTTTAAVDGSVHSFDTTAKRKAPPPTSPPRPSRVSTQSSDDEEESDDLFSNVPVAKTRAVATTKQNAPVRKPSPSDDAAAVSISEFRRESTPPPQPRSTTATVAPSKSTAPHKQPDTRGPAQVAAAQTAAADTATTSTVKHVQFVPSTTHDIVREQQTRRSDARSAIGALRASRVPGYDPDAADAERDVIIDQETFRSLREDNATEFQDANKPPWVQRVNAEQLDRNRRWDLMETLSEVELRTNDWYLCAKEVAGKLQVPIDALVVLGPSAATTQTTQKAANTSAPTISAGTTRDIGATGIGEGLASFVAATPFRDDGVQSKEAEAGFQMFRMRRELRAGGGGGGGLPPRPRTDRRDDGPGMGSRLLGGDDEFGIDQGGSFLDGAGGAPPPPRPPPVDDPGAVMLGRQNTGQIEDALLAATQTAIGLDLPQSGARFRDVRTSMPDKPTWFERDTSDAARQRSLVARADGARARTWSSRAVSTGVYYLTDNYCSARNAAYSQITSRADQLAQVPLHFFARRGTSGTVQFRIFDQFTELIAQRYRLSQNQANRGAKLASDAANIAGAVEAIIRFFVNRINFDSETQQFIDTGVARALFRQPVGYPRQFVTRTPLPAVLSPALLHTSTNPLLLATAPGPRPFYGSLATHLAFR